MIIEGETTRETLRDTTNVWFRTVDGRRRLVFHDVHTRTDDANWKATYCGVSTGWDYPSGWDPRGVRMPLHRAIRIGDPCKRCWP